MVWRGGYHQLRGLAAAMSSERGISLLEILISAVVFSIVVAGAMAALVSALKIARDATMVTEAAAFAQQTIERFRNRVACDDPWVGASPDCETLTLPNVWTVDPDTLPTGLPVGPLGSSLPGGLRQYKVSPVEEGILADSAPDCIQVMVKVQWTPPQ